ncbi:MAG TPA: hypothetical protein PK264_24100 [Hyphomicrobiaceae bacterium]|nr:hypothetical protein [Hyphomicrobiaceae bacterium]
MLPIAVRLRATLALLLVALAAVAVLRPAPAAAQTDPARLALDIEQLARSLVGGNETVIMLNARHDPQDRGLADPLVVDMLDAIEAALSRIGHIRIVDPSAFGVSLNQVWDLWGRDRGKLTAELWKSETTRVNIILMLERRGDRRARFVVYSPVSHNAKYTETLSLERPVAPTPMAPAKPVAPAAPTPGPIARPVPPLAASGPPCDTALAFLHDSGVFGSRPLGDRNYAPTVDYSGSLNVPREQIVKRIREFEQRWPSRTYDIDKATVRAGALDAKRCSVQFEYDFVLQRGERRTSGRARARFVLTWSSDGFLVSSEATETVSGR